ncbi:hypothetical protein GW916_02230 [bacterium]|nr:hypothetical protein [bacterium]
MKLLSFSLMAFGISACSSKLFTASSDVDAGRSPASERVPSGPDGDGGPSGRGEVRKDERIGALANGGHADARGLTPTYSEARAGCGSASLLRIDMGNGFSAQDVLSRIENPQYGTFSGSYMVPTWRAIPLAGGYQQWIVDYATSVEADADTLAPWLNGSAPGVSEDEVRAMAGGSEVYQHAVKFTSGAGALRVYSGQYDVGHRMAALLATMFAASSKGDPDCADYIRRTWVPKLLPNTNVAGMFDKLRITEVAKLAKEGRLEEVFNQTHENRVAIDQEIENAQFSLKTAELDNKYQLDKIKWELQESFQNVNEELQSIPGCESATSMYNTLFAGTNTPVGHAEKLVAQCRSRVYEKLSDARTQQLRIHGSLKVQEQRLEYERERLERAEERGEDREIERRQTAITRYEEKIEKLKEDNEKAIARTERYEEALELIANPEASSFTAELDRIRALIGDKQKRESDSYFKPQRSTINALEGRKRNTTDNYLTMGYMGAFERN